MRGDLRCSFGWPLARSIKAAARRAAAPATRLRAGAGGRERGGGLGAPVGRRLGATRAGAPRFRAGVRGQGAAVDGFLPAPPGGQPLRLLPRYWKSSLGAVGGLFAQGLPGASSTDSFHTTLRCHLPPDAGGGRRGAPRAARHVQQRLGFVDRRHARRRRRRRGAGRAPRFTRLRRRRRDAVRPRADHDAGGAQSTGTKVAQEEEEEEEEAGRLGGRLPQDRAGAPRGPGGYGAGLAAAGARRTAARGTALRCLCGARLGGHDGRGSADGVRAVPLSKTPGHPRWYWWTLIYQNGRRRLITARAVGVCKTGARRAELRVRRWSHTIGRRVRRRHGVGRAAVRL